jgi:hypothetical protein
MKVIAQVLDQTIGSTHIDSQGEKIPKHILESFTQHKRTPLYQNHQPEKPSIGYMENFRLVPDPSFEGEWLLKADIYFTQEPMDIEIALGGFSWSINEPIKEYKASAERHYAVLLPYPYYNDDSLLYELHNADENLSLERWYKKSADPTKIAVLVSFIGFIVTPIWAKIYDDIIWPKIVKLFESISILKRRGIQRTDFIQICEIKNHQTSLLFIPEANQENECHSKENLKKGIQSVNNYAQNDHRSITPGYHVVKLFWDRRISAYKLFHIEYKDGTANNIL